VPGQKVGPRLSKGALSRIPDLHLCAQAGAAIEHGVAIDNGLCDEGIDGTYAARETLVPTADER